MKILIEGPATKPQKIQNVGVMGYEKTNVRRSAGRFLVNGELKDGRPHFGSYYRPSFQCAHQLDSYRSAGPTQ
jgi:hypothetical protein